MYKSVSVVNMTDSMTPSVNHDLLNSAARQRMSARDTRTTTYTQAPWFQLESCHNRFRGVPKPNWAPEAGYFRH